MFFISSIIIFTLLCLKALLMQSKKKIKKSMSQSELEIFEVQK